SEKQKQLLLLSGIETIVIATYNDKAGYRIKMQLIRELGGHFNLKQLYLPYYAKDVNDLGAAELLNYVEHAEEYELKIL
ncbi:hypothetical protein, partial [Paraburkholderia sp. SIMBA_027]|uniref:hypothetical protein n=1 Tax=Paraburkholderia sp. SIMBA_027 TaxID=3085770 RepID=UPI0039787D60